MHVSTAALYSLAALFESSAHFIEFIAGDSIHAYPLATSQA